jgi:hypothetical protein
VHFHRSWPIGIAVLAAVTSGGATTIRVPSDSTTIQAGINGADPGDTVLVADGIYTGDGNRDIVFDGKGVILLSENGPDVTIIDCEAGNEDRHRGFDLQDGEDSTTVIDGFTVRNGYASNGGGMWFVTSEPIVRNCIVTGNIATSGGGGVACLGSPIFRDNNFVGNSAVTGGGVYAYWSEPVIEGNIIAGNSAVAGGGAFFEGFGTPILTGNTIVGNSVTNHYSAIALQGDDPDMTNNIIAFNIGGEAFGCEAGANPVLTCCNVYGNDGGDWTGYIADQLGSAGNISVDPVFCNFGVGNYHLSENSPCCPNHNECEALIGALEVGCDQCCIGRVGDANGSGDDEPTIGDVSVLIDAKFIAVSCDGLIECLTEGDINQSGGSYPTCNDITIGDVSMLIDYLFITMPASMSL